LDYYIEQYSLPALQKLSDDSSRLDDLENFFKHFSKMQHTQTSGCFVQNAILELSLADKQVSNAGNKLYAIILDAISQVLSNAQKYNEISKTENITDISYFLLLQIQGISVLGKAKQYVVMKTAVQIIIEYINNLRMKGEKNLLLKS
jgi:hypothetical protein